MSGLDQRALDVAWLTEHDDDLARVVATHGSPPAWSRPAAFATLVLQILEQQISLDAAAAHFGRLEDAAGEVTPAGVLALDDQTMRAAGVSRQKMRYVRELSARVADGRLDPTRLGELPDGEARAALIEVPGIGPWTASVFQLFALQRGDLFPTGDRALQVGAAEVLRLDAVPTPSALGAIAMRWAPRRSAAAVLVWHAYLAERGRTM